VLRLLATDLSIREIAERLFLSENTIRSHKGALYCKLGARSRPDAIAAAPRSA
jgi:LuxR family maltose regulon positive regulatory protein